jgi:hypothetical protein
MAEGVRQSMRDHLDGGTAVEAREEPELEVVTVLVAVMLRPAGSTTGPNGW